MKNGRVIMAFNARSASSDSFPCGSRGAN